MNCPQRKQKQNKNAYRNVPIYTTGSSFSGLGMHPTFTRMPGESYRIMYLWCEVFLFCFVFVVVVVVVTL